MASHDLKSVGELFGFSKSGKFLDASPYGSGHINDTYIASYQQPDGKTLRYLHQRINHLIFKKPDELMDNIVRVTQHVTSELKKAGKTDCERRSLQVLLSENGDCVVHDADENWWRTYLFIEDAETFDRVETTDQAQRAAAAFGEFQSRVSNMEGARLHETIPNFHHTRSRFDALMRAAEADSQGRLAGVEEEFRFAREHEAVVDVLLDLQKAGELPERVTHNDTKLNNVMFDKQSGEAICVVDLDTVMPGLVLYDFGDMVRTATSPSMEDEKDLSKVSMQMPMFEALVRGYLQTTNGFLTDAEKAQLAFSGKLISFEIGLRFLTDHLEGDVYFKTHRKGHNLDRCRTQFKLVQSIEEQEDEMRRLVDRL
ncbi:MAG: aminoglycoside phosphotransferase family protein [Chthoniobacterales bacterium]